MTNQSYLVKKKKGSFNRIILGGSTKSILPYLAINNGNILSTFNHISSSIERTTEKNKKNSKSSYNLTILKETVIDHNHNS